MKDFEAKKEISKLFENKKYKAMIQLLEALEPKVFKKVWINFVNEQYEQNKIDVYEVLLDNLSKEEWKKIKWLDSSEREKEYLMNVVKNRELTGEELSDLKACEF